MTLENNEVNICFKVNGICQPPTRIIFLTYCQQNLNLTFFPFPPVVNLDLGVSMGQRKVIGSYGGWSGLCPSSYDLLSN